MTNLAKLSYFLTRQDKVRAAGLLGLMVLGAGFETLGVALIFPFIALINNPDAAQQYRVVSWLYGVSGLHDTRAFLIWCGAGLALVYVFKAIYLGLMYSTQYRFIFRTQVALSHRLLDSYMRRPYTFHLQRNSAELLRNVNSDVLWIFSGVLVPASSVLVEMLTMTLITAVLIAIEPVAALGAIVILGGLSAGFYTMIRRKVTDLGISQDRHNAAMIKWVNQGLGGVKEVKVLGREAFFVDAYTKSAAAYAGAMRFLRTAGELPRLGIEGLTIGCLLFVVVVILVTGGNVQRTLPILGLFAMAAMRLMPSLHRVVAGVTSIRYYTSSIQAVYQDLKDAEQDTTPECPARPGDGGALTFARTIELRGVSYQFPGSVEPVLNDVSLVIEKGQSVAFVGSSGVGKTTVVDVILGLLPPTKGQVVVDGIDVHRDPAAWQRTVGYIPQRIYLSDDSIRRNIAFGLSDDIIDDERVWAAVQSAQLEAWVAHLPEGLDTVVGEHGVRLSGGQRQRIGIARALYHDPLVLVLDEATSSLDNETESAITTAITQLGRQKTIIMIAHRLTTVRHCDRLFFMKGGRVTATASYSLLLETNQDFRNMVMAATALDEQKETVR
jgi:ATP-binding cassette subfamily C protein